MALHIDDIHRALVLSDTPEERLAAFAERLIPILRDYADTLDALPLGTGKTSATVAVMYGLRLSANRLVELLEDGCYIGK